MIAQWVYDDDPATEFAQSRPTWDCPEGLCVCHPVEADSETEYSIMLSDMTGEPMPHARCRVILNGKVINSDEPSADENGWITFLLRRPATSVKLEWAPHDMPVSPEYPYRSLHHIDLPDHDEREAAIRKLRNLGFCGGLTLEADICRFQTRHHYTSITGRLEHIVPELRAYHDDNQYPVVTDEPPPLVEHTDAIDEPDRLDEVGAASSTSATFPEERAGPRVQKAKLPPAPKSKGRPKSGGAQSRGKGHAAPTRHDVIRVRFCARFAHDDALTRRWADDSHFKEFLGTTATLSIQRLGLKIKKQSPSTSKGRWFVPHQGVIRDLSLATLHAAKTKQSENAVLELEPSASHRLNTSKLDEHIGPQHVMSDPTRTGHMLMRPLFLVLVIDPNGRITKARVGNQTRQVYTGTQVKVLGGRVRILPDNTLLVDWRPDYIQAKRHTKKRTVAHPTTKQTVPMDEFIVIHQTLDAKRVEHIGFGINAALTRNACGHYLIDTDGFVLKTAAEDINTNHAGGDDGDHWDEFTSRVSKNKKPLRNVTSFNWISVGIEHVRKVPDKPTLGRTTMKPEQTVASHALIRRLWAGRTVGQNRVVTHNQIAITDKNRLGTKHSCPGAGYEWKPLENEGLALTTFFGHAFTPAEMPVRRYLDERARQKEPAVIDAAANGTGVIKILKQALADIGYLIPDIDDKYDDVIVEALFAFLMRHYSGKANETLLKSLQDGSTGNPIAKQHLVETLLEVRRIKRLNRTTKVPTP